MNAYQKEQADAIVMVRAHLKTLSAGQRRALEDALADYLRFRRDAETFQAEFFGGVCTRKCYESELSACCSREGVITFFADTVVNALLSDDHQLAHLLKVLQAVNTGFKCIFLGEAGCLWQVRPIVCGMFLCDQAKAEVFEKRPACADRWAALKAEEKRFKWPDRPVLFDDLERMFMNAGYDSPLMYLHKSPGLLRVKARAAGLDWKTYKETLKHER